MFQVGLLDSSPIFLLGMIKALADRGFSVVRAQTYLSDQLFESIDVLVADPAVIKEQSFSDFLIDTSHLLPILAIVCGEDSEILEEYTRAGAAGIVRRVASLETFYEALITVAAGGKYVDPNSQYSTEKRSEDKQGVNSQLSLREYQVLDCIARGMTHSQAARALGISPHTVDTYIRRVRKKTGLGNKAELTKAVIAINGHRDRDESAYLTACVPRISSTPRNQTVFA